MILNGLENTIIQEAIGKVEHPAIATTLVDLGLLKDITVTPDGKIALALVLPLPNIPEDMLFDQNGQPLNPNLRDYHIPRAAEMPAMDVVFVQTDEPSGPYGAKSVSEISIDGVAPAIASAVHDAIGIWIRELPYTPDRVKQAIKQDKLD